MDNDVIKKIDELNKKKIQIEDDIKILKNSSKNNGNNNSNIQIRVAHKFDKELNDILIKRIEKKKINVSKPKITELITKHKNWFNIKNDVIELDGGDLKCL